MVGQGEVEKFFTPLTKNPREGFDAFSNQSFFHAPSLCPPSIKFRTALSLSLVTIREGKISLGKTGGEKFISSG